FIIKLIPGLGNIFYLHILFKTIKTMNYTIQLIFLLLSLGFFTSCSKSSPSKCGENFFLYTAVSDEVQAFSQAALAYSENPTESNCEKYRTAVHNYITALESWEDCAKEY